MSFVEVPSGFAALKSLEWAVIRETEFRRVGYRTEFGNQV